MAKTAQQRVYLPLTASLLRRARDEGGFGPAPLQGHAVTAALVAELADGGPDPDQEDCEYAALTAAALESLLLLGPEDPPRRLVAAVDVASSEPRPGDDADPSAVTVPFPVPLRRLAALLLDDANAGADVVAARDALREAAGAQADVTPEAVIRCFDHELGWFAAQELGDVLEHLALADPGGRATIG